MAYEKMNKAAIAQMAEQYDKDTTPKKPGFWLNLFSYLGSSSNTVGVSKEDFLSEQKISDSDYVGNIESPNLMGGWVQYDNNYSPNIGSDDWD